MYTNHLILESVLVLTDSKYTPIIYTIILLVPTDSKWLILYQYTSCTDSKCTRIICINTLLVLTDSTHTPIICSSTLLILTDSTCTPNRFNSPFTQPGVEIRTLATDRHPSMRNTFADNYPQIRHQYYLCHSLWQFDV